MPNGLIDSIDGIRRSSIGTMKEGDVGGISDLKRFLVEKISFDTRQFREDVLSRFARILAT